MHGSGSKIKRSDLKKKVKNEVKITPLDYRWLIPQTAKLKIKGVKLEPSTFIINELSGKFETLTLVEELQHGHIRITGYVPTYGNFKDKLQQEDPVFSLTVRFILKKIVLEEYEGDEVKRSMAYSEFKQKILPIILYMQNCPEKATHMKQRNYVRINGKKVKIVQYVYTLHKIDETIPKQFIYKEKEYTVDTILKISDSDDNELLKEGVICKFQNLDQIVWIQKFADRILGWENAFELLGKKGNPFFDKSKDRETKISAIKASIDGEKIMQINVQKKTDYLFQLDYYDEDSEKVQIIIVVDISETPSRYDIIYVEESEDEVLEIANKIVHIFLSVLIYMRTYSWEDAKDEDGLYYDCSMTEFPTKILDKELEIFKV